MEKLLLFASIALTASVARAYDNPLGTEKVYEVIVETLPKSSK